MRVRRVAAIDSLDRDGEMAVLLDGGSLTRLSALSAAIYALTADMIDVEDLAAKLSDQFGAPADGSAFDATKDAVTELVRHGVLASWT